MKQIFDWMREQFKEDIKWYETHGINKDFSRGIIGEANKGISLVNEAEAEWESEVCEWKRNENTKSIILSPHNPHSAMWAVDVKMYPYCNCCGKPIKISEVE